MYCFVQSYVQKILEEQMFFFGMLMVLACIVTTSALTWRNAVEKFDREIFSKLDQNGDGEIDIKEAVKAFSINDLNKDGIIEYEEFRSLLPTELLNNEGLLFKIYDQNYDGQVTEQDIIATFERGDLNNDGVMSYDEINKLAFSEASKLARNA